MKSARHNRLLIEAAMPNPTVTVDGINMDRSFGAKAFDKQRRNRNIAEASRAANRGK